MEVKDMLAAVRNNRIQFATMRPPGSRFVILGRRVVVTDPPELVELVRIGDKHVFDELVRILREPERAWAAFVLLTAMTRMGEEIAGAFATNRDRWWDSIGKTAYEHWNLWLNKVREKLVWDAENGVFVEKE